MQKLYPKATRTAIRYVRRRRPRKLATIPLPETLPAQKNESFVQETSELSNALYNTVSAPIPSSSVQDTALKMSTFMESSALPSSSPNSLFLPSDPSMALVNKFVDEMKSGSIIPRIDLINSALVAYANAGNLVKLEALMSCMKKDLGVSPNEQSLEALAKALLVSKNPIDALHVVRKVNQPSEFGLDVINSLCLTYFKWTKDIEAWKLYEETCKKVVPSPRLTATMINRCAKLEQVEKAFLTYKNACALGLPSNSLCHSALIFAASKQKKYFEMSIHLFRQMNVLKMEISLPVYSNLLFACAKSAAISTAMEIWKSVLNGSVQTPPNEYICTNYLWALAAVENSQTRISTRNFHYNVDSKEISNAAQEVYEYALENQIEISSHFMSALLACYCNNRLAEKALDVFWAGFEKHKIAHNPFSFEIIFKLFDTLKNYQEAQKIYDHMKKLNIHLTYQGWRALIRCATLTDNLKDALFYLDEMKTAGYSPNFLDFKVLHMRLMEREEAALSKKFQKLVSKTGNSPNPFVSWRERSEMISNLLSNVCDNNAPKKATNTSSKGTIESTAENRIKL